VDRSSNIIIGIDRATLTKVSEKYISSIFNGTDWFRDFNLQEVGDQLWLTSNFNRVPDVVIFDKSFNVIDVITPPYAHTEQGDQYYRMSSFYDATTGRVLVGDAGSHRLYAIDCATHTIVYTDQYLNDGNKLFVLTFFTRDETTGDLFKTYQCYNTPGDAAMLYRSYMVDATTYVPTSFYPNQYITSITPQLGTSVLWGVYTGRTSWEGASGWSTDGKILKYTR
jgi:hypothetical protein